MIPMGHKDPFQNCPEILRQFLFYMQTIKGRSERTVLGYYIDLRTFFRFICLQKQLVPSDTPFDDIAIGAVDLAVIQSVTLTDVYEFLHYITAQRDNNPRTRSRKISSIKSFFHYLTNRAHLLEYNPMVDLEVPSVKKALPKYLTLEQSLELLQNVDGDYKERDYCILTLFLNCGMRLSELVGINVRDFKDNTVRLLGKGNKERIVYLNQACLAAVESYMAYRSSHRISPTDQDAFFLNRNGKRLGARRVEQIVDENLKRAGLDRYGFSTHKLRHTAATMMYQYGNVDIKILQEILGHANLGTTEIYTHISNRQMQQAADSNPLASVRAKSAKKPKEE